jgi:MraZ protein
VGKCGKMCHKVGKYFLLLALKQKNLMLNLLGEYDCKLDAKGRFMFPSGLKKQLAEVMHEGFVVNRNVFENCLVIYPMSEWNKISGQLGKLNRFIKKNEQFVRRFNNGATVVELDGAGRMLVPKVLVDYADLKKEVKVCGNGDRIELWSKKSFEKIMKEQIDFGQLAEEVMGSLGNNTQEDVS